GRYQLLQPAFDDGDVADGSEAASDEVVHRPLVAWPNEAVGDVAQEGLIVAPQSALQQVGPVSRVAFGHRDRPSAAQHLWGVPHSLQLLDNGLDAAGTHKQHT